MSKRSASRALFNIRQDLLPAHFSNNAKKQKTEHACDQPQSLLGSRSLLSRLPSNLKLNILGCYEFNFHYMVDLSLDVEQNRKRIMHQLFGYFRDDSTRTIHLLFPTLNIVCEDDSDRGRIRYLLPRCGQVKRLHMQDPEAGTFESMLITTGSNHLTDFDLTPKHLISSLSVLSFVKLRKLRLNVPLTNWCFACIVEYARNVQDLEITFGSSISNRTFAAISKLTQLEEFQFDAAQEGAFEESLALVPLKSLTKLRVLVLPEKEILDWSTLSTLTSLTNLKDLFTYNLRDTETSVLAQLHTVTRLINRSGKVTSEGAKKLLAMTKLKKFALYNENVIESHYLQGITALQDLRFMGINHHSSLFFHYLSHLSFLSSVYLYNVHVTQDAMDIMLTKNNLKRLELDDIRGLTSVFFDRLIQLNTSLEALGVQSDDNTFATRASVLKNHPMLHTLLLKNKTQTQVFAELLHSKSLETLYISVPQISQMDNVINTLATNSTLKYLSLVMEDVIDDDIFRALITHPTLEHLSLDAQFTSTYLDHGMLSRVNHCQLKRVKSFPAKCYGKGIQLSHFEFEGYEL